MEAVRKGQNFTRNSKIFEQQMQLFLVVQQDKQELA